MSQTAVEQQHLVRWHRAAADRRSAAAALGCGVIVALGFADGGYYPASWRWAAVALGAVAGLALLCDTTFRPGLPGAVSFASLGLLCAWMAVSTLWGIDGVESRQEAERCALYLTALAALLAVARASTARAMLGGVLTGCTSLALYALGHRLLADAPLDPYQGSLLKEPIGYANALGLVVAIGAVLGVGLGLGTRRRLERGACLAASAACGIALALTASRGAWVACVCGFGVLLAIGRSRHTAAALISLGALLAVLGAILLPLGDRPSYWRIAAAAAVEHPLAGTGAGTFDNVWLAHRPIPAFVRDAHSLYLETASELGLIGVVLLLVTLGMPLVAAARSRSGTLVAPAAAGYTVFLVHAGLDWDWELPVTVLAGLACGAALLAQGET